jgi:CRISPR-associated protein Cmr4
MPGEALCASKEPFVALAGQERVVLEALDYGAKEDEILQAWARWIGKNGFPEKGFDHFKQKVTKDTVLLSEEAFQHFVQNATLVEAHVRIDDESGTADDGGLFYTENLPPESLLAGLLMASRERPSRQNGKRDIYSARQVLDKLRPFLSGAFVQAGGDATSGRGGLVIRFLEGGKSHGQNA